jgi:hypothetical protein
MRMALLLGILALVAGCGGSAFTTGSDAGGTDGAKGSDTGVGGGDAGHDATAEAGADGGVDCNALLLALNEDRDKARTCCATCNIVQCTQKANDLCCPISVNDTSSPAVVAFEAALTAYLQSCGPVNCPGGACIKAPSDICGLTGRCD